MHLLREGQFSVASTFLSEIAEKKTPVQTGYEDSNPEQQAEVLSLGQIQSEEIRNQFSTMYHILDELKERSNLIPAIQWAREHRDALEARGSNLEFELCRLQFVWLFNGGNDQNTSISSGRQAALTYARQEFHVFVPRHLPEIQQLMGAMAFFPNLEDSPYRSIFKNPSSWEDIAHFFTREFCSLLGLSADSPLYIAATAGAIALPTLLKLQTIMKAKRTEWTTQNELPVFCSTATFHIKLVIHVLAVLCVLTLEIRSVCSGRDSASTLVSFPFNLCVPRFQRTDDRFEPTYDDALWTCNRSGVFNTVKQRW